MLYLYFKRASELTTTIQIGSYKNNGEDSFIETPEALLSKVNNSIGPTFTYKWVEKNNYKKVVKTNITNPKGSNIILIKNKSTQKNLELFSGFQKGLAGSIIHDHRNLIIALQANLVSSLELSQLNLNKLKNPLFLDIKLKATEISLDAQKIKLKKLKDKDFFGIKKKQFKNSIVAAKNILDLVKGKRVVLEDKLRNLNETKKLIKNNLDEIKQLITTARTNKQKAISKANTINAMSLLLIDNEIQQNQNRLLTLEERYYVDTKNQRSDLIGQLQKNSSEQENQKNKIAILEEKYKELLLNNELQIEQQQLAIDKILLTIKEKKFNTENSINKQVLLIKELQTKLDKYNQTRVVSDPVLSQKPVGMSKPMLFILIVFIVGFISTVVVLWAIFADKIKLRRQELLDAKNS